MAGLATTGTYPVPVKATAGLLLALSAMVRVAVLVPVTAGVKNTDTVQVDPAESVLGLSGQVVVVV